MLTLGWRYVFYIFGIFGFIWCLFWIFCAANRPEEHKSIDSEELQYIQENRPAITPVHNVPWKTLLSKAPVWTLVINHFCVNWRFFMFLTWQTIG